jgi:hypothetical protein
VAKCFWLHGLTKKTQKSNTGQHKAHTAISHRRQDPVEFSLAKDSSTGNPKKKSAGDLHILEVPDAIRAVDAVPVVEGDSLMGDQPPNDRFQHALEKAFTPIGRERLKLAVALERTPRSGLNPTG